MSNDEVNPYGLWELAVLSLLRETALHPYEIQRLLKERKKDDVLVLKRGSLYHAIKRLLDAGLIEVQIDRGCMTERSAIQRLSLKIVRGAML